jgi:dTDP-4-dehydrorhamnose 3,5-epimerase
MNQRPVRLIEGGLHRDERGEVRHVNTFDFQLVDRFYTICPARPNEVRGWVGHRRDWKWFHAVSGEFLLGVVQPDDWNNPSSHLAVQQFKLSADHPQVLEVPPGFATASLALKPGSALMIFSSGKIETAREDDYRFPPDRWPLSAR